MTHSDLRASFNRGELNLEQYLAAEPEADNRPVANAPKRGRRAAKKQAALLNSPYVSMGAENDAPAPIYDRVPPTDTVKYAPLPQSREVRLTCETTKVGYLVTFSADGSTGGLKAFGFAEDGTPIAERDPVKLPAPRKFVADMVATGAWRAEEVSTTQGGNLYMDDAVDHAGKKFLPSADVVVQQEDAAFFTAAPGNLKTAEAALKFVLAGNAYFTVRSLKTGVRYTFRVAKPAPKVGYCQYCRQEPCRCVQPYFVSFLSGPENTSDYTYLGMVKDSVFRSTKASARLAESVVYKAFRYVFEHLVQRTLPPQTEIWHEGRCGVCGRPLTVPESIESGIGPVCAEKGGF